jgi:hypothetical protein
MMFPIAGLLLAMVSAAPADLTGKWEGKISGQRQDGTAVEDPVLLILKQTDTKISGSVGEHEADQHPITAGTIEGNKVSLIAKHENGREYHLELTLADDQLTGTVTSGDLKVQLQARIRKE